METSVSIRKRMQEEKKLQCPRCAVPMEKLTNGKYIIDKCSTCFGVWLDKGEIQSISKQGFFQYVKDYWGRHK